MILVKCIIKENWETLFTSSLNLDYLVSGLVRIKCFIQENCFQCVSCNELYSYVQFQVLCLWMVYKWIYLCVKTQLLHINISYLHKYLSSKYSYSKCQSKVFRSCLNYFYEQILLKHRYKYLCECKT